MANATLERHVPPALREKKTGRGCSCACHSARTQSLIGLIAVGLAALGYFAGSRA